MTKAPISKQNTNKKLMRTQSMNSHGRMDMTSSSGRDAAGLREEVTIQLNILKSKKTRLREDYEKNLKTKIKLASSIQHTLNNHKRVHERLEKRRKAKREYEKTIDDIEMAYQKILDATETLCEIIRKRNQTGPALTDDEMKQLKRAETVAKNSLDAATKELADQMEDAEEFIEVEEEEMEEAAEDIAEDAIADGEQAEIDRYGDRAMDKINK